MDRTAKILIIGDYDINLRIPFFNYLKKHGYDVYVLTTSNKTMQELSDNEINSYVYKLPRSLMDIINFPNLLIDGINLVKTVNKINPDIIHIFDTIPNLYIRFILGLLNKNIISTIPGLGYIFSDDKYQYMQKLYIFLQKRLSKFTKYTVFQNEDDLNIFLKKNILSNDKAIVIRGSGIDTELFSKNNIDITILENLKRQIINDNNSLKIALVSRLIKYKGILEFLEAAKYIKEKYGNTVEFFLVGKEDLSKRGFPIATINKYRDFVEYVGFIKNIKEFIYLCDIIVLPSYYREGIPRVLLEAASLEKPLITTNVPGCKEVVIHNYNGLLIPPKNIEKLIESIEFFIKNREKINSFGKNSRSLVKERFDSNLIFAQYINLYTTLLEENK